MKNLISSVQSRLSQIQNDLKSAILDKMSNQFGDIIKIDKHLIIKSEIITHISFFDGWQKNDVHLYTNKDNYDYSNLSNIDSISDLLKIADIVSDL